MQSIQQIFRFLFAGGIAAAANFGSRFIFSIWLNYTTAIILAYLVGMAVAFVLMRLFVFDAAHKAAGPQVFKFVIVNLFAVLQTLAISLALVRWAFPTLGMTWFPEAVAHLTGVLIPVVTSYFGHRYATFK